MPCPLDFNVFMFDDIASLFRHPTHRKTAIKVSLIVGSVLFCINHGPAFMDGKMTKGRWVSGLLTYGVPFMVSLHGQHQGLKRLRETQSGEMTATNAASS